MLKRWSNLFSKENQGLTFTVIASVFIAAFAMGDNYIASNIVRSEHLLFDVSAYLVAGGWIGLVMAIFFSHFVGPKIHPGFKGISLGNSYVHFHAFSAGFVSAVATFFILLAHSISDPFTVTTVGVVLVGYTIAWDILKGKELSIFRVAGPAIPIILGSIMAVYITPERGESLFNFDWAVFLFVAIFAKGVTLISEIAEQAGVYAEENDKTIDSINFSLWRFFYLTVSATVLMGAFMVYAGVDGFFQHTVEFGVNNVMIIAFVMFFVFFGNAFRIYAKETLNISRVVLLSSMTVVFSFAMTVVLERINPFIFDREGDVLTLEEGGVRLFGAFLIIVGIVLLRHLRTRTKEE